MLMYELVESAGTEERNRSVAPTVTTVETAPESTTVSEDVNIYTGDGTPTTEPPSLRPEKRPSLEIDNNSSTTGQSLLEMVDSKLEETHISPTSSISSADDYEREQKSTRSTSFSSIHSRPRSPIFEAKDPQMSPPPLKRVRIESMDKEEDAKIDTERDGTDNTGSLEIIGV